MSSPDWGPPRLSEELALEQCPQGERVPPEGYSKKCYSRRTGHHGQKFRDGGRVKMGSACDQDWNP